MPDELVDIVNEADEVVGSATRAAMRARKLRHRAVYVLVFNRRGQLFVHRRVATKDVFPDHLDVAIGGVVQAGEGYDAAAARELEEELGVPDVSLRRVLEFRFDDDVNRINGTVYSCTVDGPLRLQPEEIVEGEWLDLDVVFERAQSERFCPDGLEALGRYLELLERARRG